MNLTRFRRIAAGAVAIALLATACGDTSDEPAADTEEQAAGTEETATDTETGDLTTLLSESASLRGDDPTLSLLLALEANRRSPDSETEQAVLDALGAAGVVVTQSVPLAPPNSSGCGFPLGSEDGLQIFQVSDGRMLRHDMTTGETTDHGESPGSCSDWVGDLEVDRKTVFDPNTDTWLLGPLDGPSDAEITYDRQLGIASRTMIGNRVVFAAFDASGVALVVFDATTGDLVAEVEGIAEPSTIVFGGDGSQIAFGSRVPGASGRVVLLDAQTGDEIFEVEVDDASIEARFDLATGEIVLPTAGGRVLTLDIESAEVVADVEASGTTEVVAVGIRPDGLIVIAREGQIEIVDRRTGPTGVVAPISDAVAMRAMPDGSVLKMNLDSTTEIINIDGHGLAGQSRDQWLERACEIAGRDLTQDEWDEFVPGDEPLQSACA